MTGEQKKSKPHIVVCHHDRAAAKLITEILHGAECGNTDLDTTAQVMKAAGHRSDARALMLGPVLADDRNAVEVIARLRKADCKKIIMVIGDVPRAERHALLKAGADDCVALKTFDLSEFVIRLTVIARGRRWGADEGASAVAQVLDLFPIDSNDPILRDL